MLIQKFYYLSELLCRHLEVILQAFYCVGIDFKVNWVNMICTLFHGEAGVGKFVLVYAVLVGIFWGKFQLCEVKNLKNCASAALDIMIGFHVEEVID